MRNGKHKSTPTGNLEDLTSTPCPALSDDSVFMDKFAELSQACHPARNFPELIAKLLNGVTDKEALYHETCKSYKILPD